MNDSRELTLQERSTKRANYCLMLTVLIISIYMSFCLSEPFCREIMLFSVFLSLLA